MNNWRVAVLAGTAFALLAGHASAAEQTQVEKVQAALDDWLAKQASIEKVTGVRRLCQLRGCRACDRSLRRQDEPRC